MVRPSGTTTAASPQRNIPVGARIWIADTKGDQVWVKAEVVEVGSGGVTIRVEADGSTQPLPETYFLRNEEVMTRGGVEQLDDLTQLTHLHEAALLNSLNERFECDSIYTFTGPILIAVNPFKRIEKLYDSDTLREFIVDGWRQVFTLGKKPHVFSTAIQAYRGLVNKRVNQTILVSGESGAGKTESTKFVMKLLAMAGSKDWEKRSPVENQVLQSNPLLEAFGNAKTLRNDNSSRFGKFIEMKFRIESDPDIGGFAGRLWGAKIHTYLLETVRVCRQLGMERNYHAFYQLAAVASKAAAEAGSCGGEILYTISKERALSMGVEIADDLVYDLSRFPSISALRYISCSGCQKLAGVDDVEEFDRTSLAMETIGIDRATQQAIWTLVGGVLFLGSLFFQTPSDNSESSKMAEDSRGNLSLVCSLLGVSPAKLEKALCNRTIVVQKEKYTKPLNIEQAEDTRDSLARALYNTMFLQIVYLTNLSIGYQSTLLEASTATRSVDKDPGEAPAPDGLGASNVPTNSPFCGVLDIFGFECFNINSIEQLFINFTNENLQLYFNHFIFVYEQTLYEQEGIQWNPLDFPDNSDCVDLLANNRDGVFSMLDEECVVPRGSDLGLCSKMWERHSKNVRFGIVKTRPDRFNVKHFAGAVEYCVRGFLDKNRDQLSQDIQDLVKESSNEFVSKLFINFLRRDEGAKKGMKRPTTVSLEFRQQLTSLMGTIKETAPHFIRCVKPNPENKPDIFHRKSVAEQLRYAGVLQAVQVSRAGFPVREKHVDTWQTYRALIPPETRSKLRLNDDIRERAQQLMLNLNEQYSIPQPVHGSEKYSWAVGKTLVFLKHEAFEVLSTRRAEMRQRNAQKIQAVWKGFIQRRFYASTILAIHILQRSMRCYFARKETQRRRELRATIIIQRFARGMLARRTTRIMYNSAVVVQKRCRGIFARQYVRDLRLHRAATRLQAFYRMSSTLAWYKKVFAAICAIQLKWKRVVAARKLAQLRREARDTAGLTNKLRQAQVQAAQLKEATHAKETENKQLAAALEEARTKLQSMASQVAIATELENLKRELEAATQQITEANDNEGRMKEALRAKDKELEDAKRSLQALQESRSTSSPCQTSSSPTSTAASPHLFAPPTKMATEMEQVETDNALTTVPSADGSRARELEMLLADAKRELHETRANFQTVVTGNNSDYLNMILDIVRVPNDPKAVPIRGDVLVIGDDVKKIAKLLVGRFHDELAWDNLNLTRLDSIVALDEAAYPPAGHKTVPSSPRESDCWYRKREFDLLFRTQSPNPLRLLLLSDSEISLFTDSNADRLRRNFKYVLFVADLEESGASKYLDLPWVEELSADVVKVLTVCTGLVPDDVKVQAYARSMVPCAFDDLTHLLTAWSKQSRKKQEELMKDVGELKKLIGSSPSGGPKAPKKLQSGRISKSQTAALVSDYLVTGLTSFFQGTRAYRGPQRTQVVPRIHELLTPSILPGEMDCPPLGKNNTEIIKWRDFNIKNRTAVTCLAFGKDDPNLKFYFLAAATKGGGVYTYKIAKTQSELEADAKRCSTSTPRCVVSSNMTPAQIEALSYDEKLQLEEDKKLEALFLEPPTEAIEIWRTLEGHEKAVTSLFFNHDGTQLVSTSIDCSVRFWNYISGFPSKIFSDSVAILVATFLATDPQCFLTSNSKSIVRLVDSEQGQVLQRMKVHSEIRAVCFDTSGLNLIAGTKSGDLEIYEVGENNNIAFLQRVSIADNTNASAVITCVRFASGQPPQIIVNSSDNRITIAYCNYSLSSVSISSVVVKQRFDISHTCIPITSRLIRNETATWFLSASENSRIKVLVKPHGGEFQTSGEIKGHNHATLAVASNGTNTVLASSDVTGAVFFWRRLIVA